MVFCLSELPNQTILVSNDMHSLAPIYLFIVFVCVSVCGGGGLFLKSGLSIIVARVSL